MLDFCSSWGGSSAGRASRSQCEGREFDPHPLHQNYQGLASDRKPFSLGERRFWDDPGRSCSVAREIAMATFDERRHKDGHAIALRAEIRRRGFPGWNQVPFDERAAREGGVSRRGPTVELPSRTRPAPCLHRRQGPHR